MFFIILIVSSIVRFSACFNAMPRIDSAKQVSESLIELTWSIGNSSSSSSISRYRVQFLNNGGNFTEWPAQITRQRMDAQDEAYRALNTRSNFDCYNECIKDPECNFAVRKSIFGQNCFLKAVNSTLSVSLYPSAEAVLIKAISGNTIQLYNLPYNTVYRFRVSIYDNLASQWSDFSELSNDVDLRIDLGITVDFVGNQRFSVISEIKGNFPNYNLSRCLLSVSKNDSTPLTLSYPITTFRVEPLYFDLHAKESITFTTETYQNCGQLCLKYEKCVFYAYANLANSIGFLNKGDCVLKTALDVTSGVYSYDNVDINSFKSEFSTMTLSEPFEYFANYTFQLSCLTPFGIPCESNSFEKTMKSSTFTMRAEIYDYIYYKILIEPNNDFQRYTLKITENIGAPYSHYEMSKIDYNDTNAYMVGNVLYFDACYDMCVFNPSCKAIRWLAFRACYLITDTSNPINCEDTCATMPTSVPSQILLEDVQLKNKICFSMTIIGGDFNTVYLANESCVQSTFDYTASLTLNNTRFIENEPLLMNCSIANVDPRFIKSIDWYIEGVNAYFPPGNRYGIDLLNGGSAILINKTDHTLHTCAYFCNIQLTAGIQIMSNTIHLKIEHSTSLSMSPKYIFYENAYAILICLADSYDLVDLDWRFDKIKTPNYNITKQSSKSSALEIQRVSGQQNGEYTCYVRTNESIFVTTNVSVRTRPPKPLITLVETLEEQKLKILWSIDNDGQSQLNSAIIEISLNFSNPNYDIVRINVSSPVDVLKGEYELQESFTKSIYLRIRLVNALGTSPFSDEYLFVNKKIQKKDKEKYFIPFVVSLTLIGCCIVAMVVFVNRKRIKSAVRRDSNELSFSTNQMLKELRRR